MTDIILLLIAYLVGAIPSAYVFTRLFLNQDIRHVGTGNVGTMNALRSVGFRVGLPTMVVDIAKGAFIVHLAGLMGSSGMLVIIALLVAIIGHNYSIYINFKGGKGFATLIGGLLLISPITIIILMGISTLFIILTHEPRLSQGLAIMFLPVVFWYFSFELHYILGGLSISTIIVMKHKEITSFLRRSSSINTDNSLD